MIKLIKKSNIRIKKRLSQHFVVDPNLINEVISETIKLRPSYVIEVGTGLGILTAYISRVVRNVVSVEIDPRLAEVANKVLRDWGCVADLIIGDGVFLLRERSLRADVVVSNAPYSITGPLLMSVLKSNCRAAVLTLQKEVAERLISRPGSRGYGKITVMINTFMDVTLGGTYPPTSFYPMPKVSSTVIVLRRVREWDPSWLPYEKLVKCLFTQRRKLVRKVIASCIEGRGNSIMQHLNWLGDRRVYELTLGDFLKIYEVTSGL